MPGALLAFHGLRAGHFQALETASSQLAGIWASEPHVGYDGNLICMLTLQPEQTKHLVVTRDITGFHLIFNQDDEYEPIGCFSTMDSLIAAIASQWNCA